MESCFSLVDIFGEHAMNAIQVPYDVLTLDEVADYLRLPKKTVERQATIGQLPARRIEHTWRFLKSAVDDWLRGQNNRTTLLQQAGALIDDKSLLALRVYSDTFGMFQDDSTFEEFVAEVNLNRQEKNQLEAVENENFETIALG